MNSAARRLRPPALALAASLLAFLAACAPLPPRTARRSILLAQALHTALAEHDWARAQGLAVRLRATAPADSPIAARALVREAWAELRAGRPQVAHRLLAGPAARALPPGRLDRAAWTFLGDRIERRPRAVRTLASALPSPPTALVPTALAFRARLAWALEEPLTALRLLVARRRLLPPGGARRSDDRLLWRELRLWVERHGALRRPVAAGTTTDGWIALADLDLSAGANPPLFRRLLTRWEARYPHHPARRAIVPRLLARLNLLDRYPSRVAVLLPRRGPYRDAARAVAGGILAARFTAGGEGRAANVRFFDTGTGRSEALRAYAAARRWGASVVIGPLLAPQVLALARAVKGHVTILALNDLPRGTPVPPRFYQFGISPEDEAREDARRALRHGRRIAGALVPRNAWGAKVLAAFRRAYERGGGILAAVAFYRPGRHDYAGTVRTLLRVDASIVRARTLESVLGRPLTFEPVARQDLEMIFMPARTEDARELRPELRYFGALGIPVYALAEVDEVGVVHRDLDGIRFPDMPWLLGRDPALAPARTEVARLWPALGRRDGRLFALGYDAYRLVPLLLHSRHPLRNPYPGATGLLYLGRGNVIHRRLDWAVFRNGRPVPIRPSRRLPSSPIPSPS
jgi:outer membrane PBP1 activator LpoA protein